MSIVAPDGTPIQSEEAAKEAAAEAPGKQGVIPVTMPDGSTILCPIVAAYILSPSAIQSVAQATAQVVFAMLEERSGAAKARKTRKS